MIITGREHTLSAPRAQFRVTRKGSKPIKFPALLVRQFIVGAEVEVTSDAIQAAMLSEIPMTFVDAVGGLVGHVLGPVRHDVSVRCAQYAAWFDAGMRLKIARRILGAKIHNSIVVLQRFRKNHPDFDCREAVATLRAMAERLNEGGDMDTLRGMEGLAARTYFQRFGGMLLKGFTFNGRNRQPPLDPVNAMLSFGYTLFSRELATVAEALGLDPTWDSFTNRNREDHPWHLTLLNPSGRQWWIVSFCGWRTLSRSSHTISQSYRSRTWPFT